MLCFRWGGIVLEDGRTDGHVMVGVYLPGPAQAPRGRSLLGVHGSHPGSRRSHFKKRDVNICQHPSEGIDTTAPQRPRKHLSICVLIMSSTYHLCISLSNLSFIYRSILSFYVSIFLSSVSICLSLLSIIYLTYHLSVYLLFIYHLCIIYLSIYPPICLIYLSI